MRILVINKAYMVKSFVLVFSGVAGVFLLWVCLGTVSHFIANTQPKLHFKEAFVSFADKNRWPLMEITLESVHYFSKRPIVVYLLDDIHFDRSLYPRATFIRMRKSPAGIYFNKIKALIDAPVDVGIYLDGDNIVNWKIDDLFSIAVQAEEIVLLPWHPEDPKNQKQSMEAVGVHSKSMPYGHASCVMFTSRSKLFLLNVYEDSLLGYFNGANYDETALNVHLWKIGIQKQSCRWDPYIDYSDIYLNQSKECRDCRGMDLAFLTIHGGKDPRVARTIFDFLKKHAGKPVYYNVKKQTWSNSIQHVDNCVLNWSEAQTKVRV